MLFNCQSQTKCGSSICENRGPTTGDQRPGQMTKTKDQDHDRDQRPINKTFDWQLKTVQCSADTYCILRQHIINKWMWVECRVRAADAPFPPTQMYPIFTTRGGNQTPSECLEKKMKAVKTVVVQWQQRKLEDLTVTVNWTIRQDWWL